MVVDIFLWNMTISALTNSTESYIVTQREAKHLLQSNNSAGTGFPGGEVSRVQMNVVLLKEKLLLL